MNFNSQIYELDAAVLPVSIESYKSTVYESNAKMRYDKSEDSDA